ncbi:MAG TPA: hypothetical protein VM537_36290 [Anaerolineae bacterium]|nr:hypothetical protein [Anaerolineae bacterium]
MKATEERESLGKLVGSLAIVRDATARMTLVIKDMERVAAETPEAKRLAACKAQLKDRKAEEDILTAAIRLIALKATLVDGKPHPAITLKNFTVLQYTDSEAFDYCVEHLPGALKLQKSPFEKVAKVAKLPFVRITSEQRASIDSNLSAYLPEEDEAE